MLFAVVISDIKKIRKENIYPKKIERVLEDLQINCKIEFIWDTLGDIAYFQNIGPFHFENSIVFCSLTADGCNKKTTIPGLIKDSGKRSTYSYIKL